MVVGYAFMLDVMTALVLTALVPHSHRWPITCWGRGIKTESILHSSTTDRMHSACHWHITAFGKQTMSAVIFANGFARALERASFVRVSASYLPTAPSNHHAYNLIWFCDCWRLDLCQPWNKAGGKCPRTLQPARCEVHKYTQKHKLQPYKMEPFISLGF